MQPRTIGVSGDAGIPPANGESFYGRRAGAYAMGEAKARRREISADAYLFLYKELVGLAGERTYCWPGLDYLAGALETSEGTVKRWMRELERAGLIRRKARPGGLTSLTFITAYLNVDEHPADRGDDAVHDDLGEPAHRDDAAAPDAAPVPADAERAAAQAAAEMVAIAG